MSHFHFTAKALRSIGTLALALFLAALTPALGYPAEASLYQRMGVPAGTRTIAPHATLEVPAFCLDQSRPAPTPGAKYSQVLWPQNPPTVQFGGSRISLNSALASHGPLRITGHFVRPDDSSAPQADRTGDYTSLVFHNDSSRPLKLTFSEGLVVAQKGDTSKQLDADAVAVLKEGDIDPFADSFGIGPQHRIWASMNKPYQALMKDIGAYTGDVDGNIGSEPFQKAIQKFKTDSNIPFSTEMGGKGYLVDKHPLDDRTKAAIRASSNQVALASLNKANGNEFVTAQVERSASGYRVSFGDNKWEEVASPKSIPPLIERNVRSRKVSADKVYLIPGTTFNQRDAFALAASLDGGGNHNSTGDFSFHVSEPSDTPIALNPFFSKKVQRVADDGSEPKMIDVGGHRAYQKLLDVFFKDQSKAILDLRAEKKPLLKRFVEQIKLLANVPQKKPVDEMTVAQLLTYAEADFASKQGITRAQARRQISAEVRAFAAEPELLPVFAMETTHGISLGSSR